MELLKAITVRDNSNAPSSEANALEHEKHFKHYFEQKEYSCFFMLVLNLDPANGIVEVIRNEYAENDLKKRTIINAAAKSTQVVRKKSLLGSISTAPMFYEDPEMFPELNTTT
jgi:hypothetical protein